MQAAFAAVWRRDNAFARIEFSGRTDRAILRDALHAAACSNRTLDDDVRRFKRAYFRRLGRELVAHSGHVLDGVPELLKSLDADPDATVGLATGNFRLSAGMKLRHYGIDSHFSTGGFGDRAEERPAIVEQALRAAKRAYGNHRTVFVIGDTVHDVTSAKANGVLAVGVTTGPSSAEELSRAGADIVLSSLAQAQTKLISR